MIQLKVRRTNSFDGSWACEEIGKNMLDDPIGYGKCIEDAIGDFIRSYEILMGIKPMYTWR